MTVLISLCTRESIRAELVQWLLREQRSGKSVDIVTSLEPIDWNRNEQVRRFLRSKHSHLFIVDSDALPTKGTIEALLFFDKPVVMAPNLGLVQDVSEVKIMAFDAPGSGRHFIERGETEMDEQGLQHVFSSGMSGLLVRREVIEAIEPPWFRFHYDEDGKYKLGEDMFFFNRVAEAGFEFWVDYNNPGHHWKTFDLLPIYQMQENRKLTPPSNLVSTLVLAEATDDE